MESTPDNAKQEQKRFWAAAEHGGYPYQMHRDFAGDRNPVAALLPPVSV